MIDYHRSVAILIAPVYILLGLFVLIQTRRDYNHFQSRSRSTSIICLFYHDSFVALTAYSSWFSTWPFFDETRYFDLHVFFFSVGGFFAFISIILYVLYLFKMKSILRAIGRNPDKLVTEGIFNKTRNPQSLARAIGLISLSIWGRSFHALFLALFWISINHPYILVEENFLKKIFGENYFEYYSNTPRYLGLINTLKKTSKN